MAPQKVFQRCSSHSLSLSLSLARSLSLALPPSFSFIPLFQEMPDIFPSVFCQCCALIFFFYFFFLFCTNAHAGIETCTCSPCTCKCNLSTPIICLKEHLLSRGELSKTHFKPTFKKPFFLSCPPSLSLFLVSPSTLD